MSQWTKLWHDEDGQDTTEYVLLVAFVALTTAALITAPAASISQMWLTENSEMSTAASVATS
jgi:Flp pilus assembly pilin Flp